MRHRTAAMTFSAVTYGGFVVVIVWTMVFLTGAGLPRTVDGPVRAEPAAAILTDAALLVLFAVSHSVLARRPVKRRLERWVPRRLERTVFVLVALTTLALLLWFWQPVDGWVWHLDGPGAAVLWVGYLAGWALTLVSTGVIDHLEFLGLRQTGWANPSGSLEPPPFVQKGLYGLVRHPMMLGLVVVFWCTPRMSVGHLLLATAATGYIVVGSRLEERDLRRQIGPAYTRYAEHVPALLPRPRRSVARTGPRRRAGAV